MPSTALYSADPSNPLVRQALAYNHLTSVPADWAMNSAGRLVLRSNPNTQVAVGTPGSGDLSFWQQLLHATPYIAGAVGMGALGAIGGGGGAAASGGVGIGETGAVTGLAGSGFGAAPIGSSLVGTAGLGGVGIGETGATTGLGASGVGGGSSAASTGGAFDAAGNFVGNSTYNIPSSVGSGLTGDLTRAGIGTAGNLISGYLQARAAGKASDAQQRYLEEALAYAKEQDAINRRLAAEKVQLEASRYADYSGRIAPYLATGSDANARMANVMGLPSPAPYTANPTGPTSTTPRITTQPVPPSMPSPAPVPPTPPVSNPSNVPRGTLDTPQTPQTAGGMVHVQAPDGSQRLVPASQLQHWLSKGAAVVS